MKNNNQSAGCLIYRITDSKLFLLLIHRKKKNDWSFPKGRLNKNENIFEGSIREASEETGRQIILQRYLGFTVKKKENNRKIHYFAAKLNTHDIYSPAIMAQSDYKTASTKEIDKINWFNAKDALKKVSRKKNKKILKKLIKYFENNKLNLNSSCLLRHSYAMNRETWSRIIPDTLRPLSDKGKKVAKKISPIISNYGFTKLYSSTSKRCLQTIEPYSKVSRLGIKEIEKFSEKGAANNFNDTKLLFKKIILNDSSLICSHLPVIYHLLTEIKLFSNKKIIKKLNSINEFKPASMIVFFHNNSKIIDCEFISLY